MNIALKVSLDNTITLANAINVQLTMGNDSYQS